MSGHPKYCLGLDIETTGLDPRTDEILEIAFILTEFAYPYKEINHGHFLISGPGRIQLLAGQCSEFIQQMHATSGLTKDLEDPEKTKTLPSVENELLALSETWPTDKDQKVVLAGSSAHFDLGFLRHHMKSFSKRLSHRIFDASNLKLVARSLGMRDDDKSDKREPAHRAMADVEMSITLMREYIGWLTHASLDRVCTTRWCFGEGQNHKGLCVDASVAASHHAGDCGKDCSVCAARWPIGVRVGHTTDARKLVTLNDVELRIEQARKVALELVTRADLQDDRVIR